MKYSASVLLLLASGTTATLAQHETKNGVSVDFFMVLISESDPLCLY